VDEHDHELYNISAACNELLNLRIMSCTIISNLEHQTRRFPVFPSITEGKCGTQLLWNTELHCAIRGMDIILWDRTQELRQSLRHNSFSSSRPTHPTMRSAN
jgi:hypothetical protein